MPRRMQQVKSSLWKLDAELGLGVTRCGELPASQAPIFTSREHTSLLSLLSVVPSLCSSLSPSCWSAFSVCMRPSVSHPSYCSPPKGPALQFLVPNLRRAKSDHLPHAFRGLTTEGEGSVCKKIRGTRTRVTMNKTGHKICVWQQRNRITWTVTIIANTDWRVTMQQNTILSTLHINSLNPHYNV